MIDPNYIIGIILKRRWLLILPFLPGDDSRYCTGHRAAPDLQRQHDDPGSAAKVPDEYVRSIVSADIDSRINTISQQILSRSNLERIIEEFKLFSGPESQKMFMEDKLDLPAETDFHRINSGKQKGAGGRLFHLFQRSGSRTGHARDQCPGPVLY
jgi:hypothetical protein